MVLLIAAVFAACAHISPGLEPYVLQFRQQSQDHHCTLRGRPIFVLLLDQKHFDPPVVGLCSKFLGFFMVKIDQQYWDVSSDWERRMLVFHELGHCYLGKDHNDTMLPGECPASIMHSNIVFDRCQYLNDHYIEELFQCD